MKKLEPETIRAHKGISFVGVTTTFFCYDGKGKFLMAKRSKNSRDERGKWEIGAGGLKAGIPIEENVRREIKEEYGADAFKLTPLGYRDIHRKLEDGTPTHWIGIDFAVLINPKEVKINEPDMFDDIGWFTLDVLPAPLHSQASTFFKKYKKEIAKVLEG